MGNSSGNKWSVRVRAFPEEKNVRAQQILTQSSTESPAKPLLMQYLTEALHRRLDPRVRGWLIAHFGLSSDEAEDLSQQVFVKLKPGWRGFTIQGEGCVSGYVFRIARHECYDYLQKRNEEMAQTTSLEESELPDEEGTMDRAMYAAALIQFTTDTTRFEDEDEAARLVNHTLQHAKFTLPEQQVFTLRQVQKFTDAQIRDELQLTCNQLYRINESIQRKLKKLR